MQSAAIESGTSFNKYGNDAVTKLIKTLFEDVKEYCKTPSAWQIKTPKIPSKICKIVLLVLCEIPQQNASGKKPKIKPPVKVKRCCAPPWKP